MIRVVTTCNAEGWHQTGREMVRTFLEYWPDNAVLHIYEEGFRAPEDPRVLAHHLPRWHYDWKLLHERHLDAHGRDPAHNPPRRRDYNFKRDCVRFSHKVAALTDVALVPEYRGDLLIWMDADTLTHAPVDGLWVRGLVQPWGNYMGWLDRAGNYPECGFLIFDTAHAVHTRFMTDLRDFYSSDQVFHLDQTHDSFVIQHLVKVAVRTGIMPKPYSISGLARVHHHVFPNSVLGERLDHAKGAFKEVGRTPPERLSVKRAEAHWKR